MIKLYRRLTRGCRSLNQLNAVHISLETRMTPLEVTALWSGLTREPRQDWPVRTRHWLLRRAAKLPLFSKTALSSSLVIERRMRAHSKSWISEQRRRLGFASRETPAPFVRRRVRYGLSMFESEAGGRQGKTLLICFSGNGRRMMMATPVFLQHIDAHAADVAYLRTEQHHGYRAGVRGVADDLEQTIVALGPLLDVQAYKRVATMGTSGGGLPAILAGLRLGADAVLAAGPNNPNDRRWDQLADAQGAAALFGRFTGRSARVPDVHLVHGANNERDAEAARVIASCIEVRSITSVPDAEHGCLYQLVERRQFEQLLRSTVLV